MATDNTPRVPQGLRNLMKNLTREILKEKPTNIYHFAENYFLSLLREKENYDVKNYEPTYKKYDFSSVKTPLSYNIPMALAYTVIPDGLTELLKDIIKAVLREQPENLCEFAVEYFRHLRNSNESHESKHITYEAYENYFLNKDRFFYTPFVKCFCGRFLGQGLGGGQQMNIHTQSLEFSKNRTSDLNNCCPKSKGSYGNTECDETAEIVSQNKYNHSARVIQRYFRQYIKKKREGREMNEETAALIIQKSLRRLFGSRKGETGIKSKETLQAVPQLQLTHLENDNLSEEASYTSASTAILSASESGRDFFDVSTSENIVNKPIIESEEQDNDEENCQKSELMNEPIKELNKLNDKIPVDNNGNHIGEEHIDRKHVHALEESYNQDSHLISEVDPLENQRKDISFDKEKNLNEVESTSLNDSDYGYQEDNRRENQKTSTLAESGISVKCLQEEKQEINYLQKHENDLSSIAANVEHDNLTERNTSTTREDSVLISDNNCLELDNDAPKTNSHNERDDDTNDCESETVDTVTHSPVTKGSTLKISHTKAVVLDAESSDQDSKSDNRRSEDIPQENKEQFKMEESETTVNNEVKTAHDENQKAMQYEMPENGQNTTKAVFNIPMPAEKSSSSNKEDSVLIYDNNDTNFDENTQAKSPQNDITAGSNGNHSNIVDTLSQSPVPTACTLEENNAHELILEKVSNDHVLQSGTELRELKASADIPGEIIDKNLQVINHEIRNNDHNSVNSVLSISAPAEKVICSKKEDSVLISENNDTELDQDAQEKSSQNVIKADPNLIITDTLHRSLIPNVLSLESNNTKELLLEKESTDQDSKSGTVISEETLEDHRESFKIVESENEVNNLAKQEIHGNDHNAAKEVESVSISDNNDAEIDKNDQENSSQNDITAEPNDKHSNIVPEVFPLEAKNANESILDKELVDQFSKSGTDGSKDIHAENNQSFQFDESENTVSVRAKRSQDENQIVVHNEILENDNTTTKAESNIDMTTENIIQSDEENKNDSKLDKSDQENSSQDITRDGSNDNPTNNADTFSSSLMPKKDPLNGNNTYASSLGKESTAQMSNSGTEDSEVKMNDENQKVIHYGLLEDDHNSVGASKRIPSKEEDKTLISETNDSDFDKDFQEKYSQKDVTADPNSNKNGDRESTDQASRIGTDGSKDILTENGEPLKFEEPENVVNIRTNRSQNENEHPIHYEVHENDPNTGKAVFDISTPSKREDSVSISENDSPAINEDAEDNCANPNDSEILHKKSTDKLSRNVSEGSGEKPSEEILQENKESVKLDESENSINIMAKQSQDEKQQVVQYETLENDNDTPKAVLNVVTTTEKSIPSNIEASNDSQFDKVAQETFSQNGVTADTNDNRSNITDTLSHSVIPKEFPLETNNINELFLDKDSTEQVSKSDNEVLRDISGENEAVFKSKYSDNSVDNMTKRIHDENKQNIDFELQENTKELISDEQPSVQDSKDGTEYSKDVPSIEHVNRDKEPEAINDSLKNISKLSLENCGNEVSSHLKENEEYLQHATSVLPNDLEATTSEYIMPSTTTDKTLENNLGGMAEKNSQISRPTINKSSISNDDPDSAEIHAHDTSMKNTSITENCDIQNVNREKVNDHIENKEEALVSNDSFFRSEINENNASTENAADSATVLQSEINNNNTEENVKNETNNFEEVEHDINMSGKPAILYSNPREMSHPENLDETNNFAEGEHDIKTSGKPANTKDNLHPENLEPENIFTISINKDNTNSSCDNIVTNDKLGEDINKITKHESETTPVSKIDNLGSTIIADSTISNVKADLENDNISSEETENGILRHVTNDDVDPKLEDSKDTINSDTNVDNKSAIPSEEVVENSNAIKTKENNIESDLSIDTAKNLESFDRDLKVDNENLDEDGAQPILVTIRDVQVDITSEDSQGTSDRNIENIEPEMLTIDQDIDDAAPKIYQHEAHSSNGQQNLQSAKECKSVENTENNDIVEHTNHDVNIVTSGGSVTVDNAATLENRSTTEIDPQECNNKIQASNNSLDGVHLISPTSETSSKISNNIDMSMEECHESIKEKKILQETTLESLNNMDPPTTERSNEVVQIKKELQVSDDSKRDDANCVRGPSLSEEKKDTDLKQVSQEVNTLTHDAQVTNQTSMPQIANIDDVTRHDTHEAVGTPEVEYRVKRDTILISDTSHLDDGQNEKGMSDTNRQLATCTSMDEGGHNTQSQITNVAETDDNKDMTGNKKASDVMKDKLEHQNKNDGNVANGSVRKEEVMLGSIRRYWQQSN